MNLAKNLEAYASHAKLNTCRCHLSGYMRLLKRLKLLSFACPQTINYLASYVISNSWSYDLRHHVVSSYCLDITSTDVLR